MNEKDKLWKTVVKAKYGAKGLDWIPGNQNGTYGAEIGEFLMGSKPQLSD